MDKANVIYMCVCDTYIVTPHIYNVCVSLSEIYITKEYYSSIEKKKKILPHTAWMGLEDIMLYEISQTNTVGPHLYVEL